MGDFPQRHYPARGQRDPWRVEPKQYMYYQYLLISPSYYQAHLYRTTDGQKPPVEERVADLDSVLAVYDVAGNVFTQPFEIWWERSGAKLFKNADRTVIGVEVDQAQSREYYLEVFQKELDEFLAASRQPLVFLNGGAQERSMMTRLIMVQAMTLYPVVYNTPVERWRLALALGLSPDYRGADGNLRPDSEPSVLDADDRNQLDVQAHNNLKAAINIAENAARGRYADANQLGAHLEFDFELLSTILANNYEQELELSDTDLEYMRAGETRSRVLRWYENPMRGRRQQHALTREQIIEAFELIRNRRNP
jgi:hypothetical protein